MKRGKILGLCLEILKLQSLKDTLKQLENKDGEFEVIDCRLNPEVQEIKRTTAAKEVNIKYENNQKIIDVKRKIPEV